MGASTKGHDLQQRTLGSGNLEEGLSHFTAEGDRYSEANQRLVDR